MRYLKFHFIKISLKKASDTKNLQSVVFNLSYMYMTFLLLKAMKMIIKLYVMCNVCAR